jgi:hypothetical protein
MTPPARIPSGGTDRRRVGSGICSGRLTAISTVDVEETFVDFPARLRSHFDGGRSSLRHMLVFFVAAIAA